MVGYGLSAPTYERPLLAVSCVDDGLPSASAGAIRAHLARWGLLSTQRYRIERTPTYRIICRPVLQLGRPEAML